MNRSTRILLALALPIAVTALVASPGVRSEEPPPPSATPTQAPSASVTGSATVSVSGTATASAAPVLPPVLRGESIPTSPTDRPAEKEWRDATQVSPNKAILWRDCSFRVLRDWLRVSCERVQGAGLVMGDPKGVQINAFADTSVGDELAHLPPPLRGVSKVLATLPVRRGESRVLQVYQIWGAGPYGNLEWVPVYHVAVQWREGRADPTITVASTCRACDLLDF